MKELPNLDPKKLIWPEEEELDIPTRLVRVFKDAVYIIIGLLALIAVVSWSQMKDAEDKLEDQKRVTQKYIGHLSTAFNGGTLLDRATGTAFFFDKPVEVKL